MAPLFNTVLTCVESFLTFCNGGLTKLATRFMPQFGRSSKNVRFFKQFGSSPEHYGFLWPFSAVWRGLLGPPFFLFLSRISAHRCAPEASISPMRTPRPRFTRPESLPNAPKTPSIPPHRRLLALSLPLSTSPIQTPLKRRPNALQTRISKAFASKCRPWAQKKALRRPKT